MTLAIRHRGRSLTFESACEEEGNLLLRLQHEHAAVSLRRRLWTQRDSLANLVRHQLGLGSGDACELQSPESWLQGAFNVCIPVEVMRRDASTARFILRCPMPHKLAEDRYPGTIDEKVSCEAASYVWMQEHCNDIRIPHLYAFGFADGRHFTHARHRPLYHHVYRSICRWFHRSLHLPLLSNYICNTSAPYVGTAYSILEYLGPETGQMLSLTWSEYENDAARRARLYRGMARIMLSLARIPQPLIGAYRFNADATVTLTNRPLTCAAMIMENNAAPRTIQSQQTYQSVESFTSDMLTLHDNYLLHQPHAVRNEDDAHERFTIRTLLRAVSHHFILPRWRNGPYLLQLTDFHQSNIFVDRDWNVTGMIDLEWICSLPVEMLAVPYWLTSCSIDNIIGKQYDRFDQARQDFLAAMDEEAQAPGIKPMHGIQIARSMRESWLSKGVWFWSCLRSLNGWLFVFEDHVLPKFSANNNLVSCLRQASSLWREDVDSTVRDKVDDEAKFKRELQVLFESAQEDGKLD